MRHQAHLQVISSAALYPVVGQYETKTPTKISKVCDLNPAPPHALIENEESYSIVFNMVGVEQKGIGIDIDADTREVTVLARRDRENLKNGFFWVFGVPRDAHLARISARFKVGVLEVVIPKRRQSIVD